MEEFVKEMGFASLEEFNRLVATVDINSKEKMKSFIDWKENDGTKEGLLLLFSDSNNADA
jgi:hypothetical protein